jgi:hypothetical protein
MRPGFSCTDKGRFGRSPLVANGAIYGVRAHGVKPRRAETGSAGEIRGQAGISGPGLRWRFIRATGPGIQKPDLSKWINVIWPGQPLNKNISVFQQLFTCGRPKSLLYFRNPVPLRGALRNVNSAGRGAVDANALFGRTALRRAVKSCGPGTPKLVSSSRQGARATVARKPGRRGEHV